MFKRVRHNLALLAPAVMLAAWGLPGAALAQADAAKRGEIVVRFPREFSDDQIAKAVKDAGCTIKKAIPFSFHYYVLVAPDSATKAVKAAPVTRSVDLKRPGVTSAVADAVEKLTAMPGVVANPNWYIKAYETGKNSKPIPLVPLAPPTAAENTPARRGGKTRQADDGAGLIPNDPLYGRQEWHMGLVNMPRAWAIQSAAVANRAVRVAVSDTGFKTDHPDFVTGDNTSLFTNPVNVTQEPVTTNVAEDLPTGAAHGTHVTGTIAARTNNGTGLTGVAGLRTNGVNIRIIPIKMFSANPNTTTDTGVAAVNYATAQDADVHNMSWGPADEQNPPADPVFETALAAAIARGTVMVAAAGNSGATNTGILPGTYPGVIRVTSVGPDAQLASYSSYGPGVDIAAPGGDGVENGPDVVWSTSDPITPIAQLLDGSYYQGINGTSMASPHVAGAAALLIAAGVPRSGVQQALVRTARPLDETPVYDGSSFSKYGGGLLDVYAALLPFSDPAFSISVVGAQDLGQTFTTSQAPLTLQAIGVTKAPATGVVTLEVQTATFPASVVRRFVEGTDFTIPRTLGEDQPRGTAVLVTAPGSAQAVNLPPGRYKYVLKVGETVVGQVFTEVVSRTQPQGRTLFASPFLSRNANATQPEQALLGFEAVFSLARYNPFRLPTDFEYALFQSAQGGRRDAAASFSAALSDGSPVSFQITDRATSIAPVGLGYWLNLDRTVTLNPAGATVENSVGVRLSASNGGWNMVGAPFTGPSSWGSCAVEYNGILYSLRDAVDQGLVGNALIGYSGGDYVYNLFPFGTLEPFNGYWVRAFVDCTLVIPPAGITRSALTPTRRNGLAIDAAANAVKASNVPGQTGLPKVDGWRGRLIARVAGDRDGQNYFGQSRSAKAGIDTQDVPKPPSGAGHAYVRFVSGTGSRAADLAFDMRPQSATGAEEWTALVSTDKANTDVTLTWDTLAGLPRNARLTLTDTVNGKTVDMRSRSSYTFRSGEAGATRTVKLNLTPGTSRGLMAITGVTIVPGGRSTGGGMSVRYATTDDADVTASVKSLSGKDLGVFTGKSRSAAGVANTLHWNGRLKDGSPIPPGAYLIVIRARGVDGQTATFSQPVQSLQ